MFTKGKLKTVLVIIISILSYTSKSQYCSDPNRIYGLRNDGFVYPINTTTGAVGSALNTNNGQSPSSANGLGFNKQNDHFYFFKRNPGGNNQEFVTFSATNTVTTVLASCPTTNSVLTGCVNNNGSGYYCIDNRARLFYYEISTNTWTFITANLLTNSGVNISNTIQNLSGGDIAIDIYGQLWIVASSATKYCLYRVLDAMPTTPVTLLHVAEVIPPTTNTPEGTAFAGICFTVNGEAYMATLPNNNKLYKLNSNLTLTYLSTFNNSGVGNDLTSCNFPVSILPIMWHYFNAYTDGSLTYLKWGIDIQSDEKDFFIENSLDGIVWEEIGHVASKPKLNSTTEYNFTTRSGYGVQFYRIRQVDMNGNISYTDVKSVYIKGVGIKMWPNPTDNVLYLQSENILDYQIVDQIGRVFKKDKFTYGLNNIDVSKLKPGYYFIRIQLMNGSFYHQKFNKR